MLQAVRNGVENAGIPLPEALRMASLYPATVLGEQDKRGFIQPGANADLVLLDEQLNLLQVMVDGEEIGVYPYNHSCAFCLFGGRTGAVASLHRQIRVIITALLWKTQSYSQQAYPLNILIADSNPEPRFSPQDILDPIGIPARNRENRPGNVEYDQPKVIRRHTGGHPDAGGGRNSRVTGLAIRTSRRRSYRMTM